MCVESCRYDNSFFDGESMENSDKYFENRKCKYYPCHQDMQDINCMFCYCPFYNVVNCPGKYKYIESNGRQIKECTVCTFPHKAENYEVIIAILSNK